MQHRRAYQAPHTGGVANGHLVKLCTNEELLLPGQVVDLALITALCSEEGDEVEGSGMRGVISGSIKCLITLLNRLPTSHAVSTCKIIPFNTSCT